MLFGITGKAGSGKDTVAGIIAETVDAFVYHFADPLKEMALILDPIVEIGKEPDGSPHICRLSGIVSKYGWHVAKQTPEVRRFLQKLGTEAVRGVIGDSTWVELMLDEFYSVPHHHFIVPDTRFLNEAHAIQGTGHGMIVRVRRGSAYELGSNAAHPSETEMDQITADYEIDNDGSLDDLRVEVEAILEDVGAR